MVADMVTDMEVDMVADMEVDNLSKMKVDTIFGNNIIQAGATLMVCLTYENCCLILVSHLLNKS